MNKRTLSYRCICDDRSRYPHIYLDDIMRWDIGLGQYRSVQQHLVTAPAEAIESNPDFKPLRQPKFGDPVSVQDGMHMRHGFVLSHEPKNQVHPAMTTVAYEDESLNKGYGTKHINASLTRYLNQDIDPCA